MRSRPIDLAARLVGGTDKVVNSIVVRGRDQVMLKVTVAEVQRDVIKQLGIDLNGSLNFGTGGREFQQHQSVPGRRRPAGRRECDRRHVHRRRQHATATLRAMERAGVVRTLAEPNLTAISGEAAAFLAGGEFPIPKGYTCDPVTRSVQHVRSTSRSSASRLTSPRWC